VILANANNKNDYSVGDYKVLVTVTHENVAKSTKCNCILLTLTLSLFHPCGMVAE